MSRTSNLLRTGARVSVTALTLSVFLSPSAAFAAPEGSAFCTNLPKTISTVNNSIASMGSKLDAGVANRTNTFTSNRTKWDSELATKRQQWDQQRQESFTKLEAKATTDAQKAAVKTYETAVINAVNTRRAANDAARDTFRQGVLNLANGRQSNVQAQIATFKAAVTAAENAAQASCSSTPTEGVAIRTTFRNALKSAREAYAASRKSDTGVGDQVKALAQTRDATIKANDATFKSTIEAARQALQAVFKNTNV